MWIYPKKPGGRFYDRRKIVSYALLALLFSGPFLRIDQQPVLLLDILERKFVVLGRIFWPQDFYIFVLAMLILILFIMLFTVVFGRIFCGWLCPQTIFMEMVFRRIEYWIEGDYTQQKHLRTIAWSPEWIMKKSVKFAVFGLISFLIANTFLAYLIGSEKLIEIVTDPPSAHVTGLFSILGFSGVFYFVFAWFREQVCIVVCPYGRLQGVMLDRNTVVVAYDYLRGEKRGKHRKDEDRAVSGKGDCIDCHQCVHVCPTGIDIRNGTQLECVNCTACIDACDDIMDKVGYKRGLIRFDSEAGISEGKSWRLTPRTWSYTAVLLVLIGVFSFLLISRNEVEASLLRTPGMLYQMQGDSAISNLFNLKVINKSNRDLHFELAPMNFQGLVEIAGRKDLVLKSGGSEEAVLLVVRNRNNIPGFKSEIEIGLFSGGAMIEKVNSNFMAPAN